MDWLLDVFATWLYGLKVIAITLAVIMFISGLDDFFIDVVYWVRRIKRKLSVYRRYPRMSYRELYKPDEKPLAIMVPAWNETGVIGNMAELAATTLDYENYHIFDLGEGVDKESLAEGDSVKVFYVGELDRKDPAPVAVSIEKIDS